MAIAASGAIIRAPFARRQGYGGVEAQGMAAGHVDVTGNATGGAISASLVTDGGYLYRLELLQASIGSGSGQDVDVITSHRWLEDRTGLGLTALDLNWVTIRTIETSPSAFQIHTLPEPAMAMLRRVPIGRTDDALLSFVVSFNTTNTDLLLYDFDAIFTYWRKESLYRPGFLEAFQGEPRTLTPLPPALE